MKTRRPGCFHPITLTYSTVGVICLLAACWLFQYARSAQPTLPGHFGNFDILLAFLGAIDLTLSGIVILGGILVALILTRKK